MKSLLLIMMCGFSLLAGAAEPRPATTEERFDQLSAKIDETYGSERKAACSNLYEFVHEIIRLAEGTPGKEAANFLRTGNLARAIEDLKDGKSPNAISMSGVRQQTLLAALGPAWPRPPAIDVPYAKQPPVIDGHLDDAVWATAAVFTNSYVFNETNAAPTHTTYRILWDTNNLYFAFDCVDTDLVAPVQARDEPVYRDDCVEMFILTEPRFRTYWELDVSPSGCIFDSLQQKRPNEWGALMDPSENIAGLQVGVSVRGTLNHSEDRDEGYTVEIAVPFNQLPGYTHCAPAPGQTLTLMLARLDRNNTLDSDANGHPTTNSTFKAYAFTPLLSWGHNIWNHSRVILKP